MTAVPARAKPDPSAESKRAAIARVNPKPDEASVAAARVQKRRERRCFWTWPFGHVWSRYPPLYGDECAYCGKEWTGVID